MDHEPRERAETENVQVHQVGKRHFIVADVEPLDVDGVRTVEVGTAIFFVAFLALLPFYGRLSEDGNVWWLWSCLAGVGLGLLGLEYCRRRRRVRLQQQAESAGTAP